MENMFYPENDSTNDMMITPQAKEFLRETAKWTKFLAILGFIFMGFGLIASFFLGAVFNSLYSSMGIATLPSSFFIIYILIIIAIYIMPLYYLLQFSNKAKIAVEANDTNLMTEALGFLKSHYKYIGILMIIFLSLYALMFVIGIIVGVAGAALAL